MSRALFSQARTGRRARTSNFTNVGVLEWEIGKSKRIVIPLHTDKKGNKGVVLFGQTIHRVDQGVVKLPRSNGGTYSTYTFRCSHPYSQLNFDEARSIAKKEEMCVLCEYEKLQNTRRMGIMAETYGTEEEDFEDWGDNFKNLTKEEKKEFFQKHPFNVEKSYYTKEVEDGENYNVQTTEMYMLVYDIEVEEVTKKVKLTSGKTRQIKEYQPVLDADGNVKYKPALFKVSEDRLNRFKDAIENELASETISYDTLDTIIENEGTEYEEEINVGWIDYELKYPQKDGKTARMESARGLTIHATVDAKSILLNNEGLLEQMEESIVKDYTSAKGSFENVYKNLQLYSREEQLALLDPELRGEFEQLREEYRTEDDEEFEQGIYATVLNAGNDSKDKEDVEEELDEEDLEEEKPKKKATKKKTASKKTASKKTAKTATTKKKTATKKKAKPKKEEPEESEDLDDDLELEEEELFQE